MFKLNSQYSPCGDQPQAIAKISEAFSQGQPFQTLLGVTGSGKTFTMANIIQHLQKKTLILAHNKTLAAQLFAEFRAFFPDNAVEYFVSYYDYYQPEAYVVGTDTYIEKDSSVNDEIDKLRHSATKSLLEREDVIVVPFNTSFEKIKSFNPQGILLSNGPGDPKSIQEVIPTIQKLQESYPLFSICMGHQIFALANGANTIKMKFGHRGGNHPVTDFENKRVYITSQNHGYCVDENSLANTPLKITQVNLNDKTIEGLRHTSRPAFSVQYHPEANPGPNDTKFLFDQFMQLVAEGKNA